ncbi:hypothetical protein [Burkholderia cenocepacia]|uniref:hypothetical protein n=1 Tax=Burkholderia cenocepacia TaxID=95486 RepID=UPI002B24A891|nr:hypothetical protein [Burkholderia cenocepacia]MEB2500792.1 hypothetical protein [Burkholderia cenocepacia]MEB2558195.1 hypothetical protein [Burkholderia cenocepacia]
MASEPEKSDHNGLFTGATLLGVLGIVGAVGKWGLDVYRARVIALTDSGRRALDNAEQLEAYAYRCRQLINENAFAIAQISPESQPEHFEFAVPELVEMATTGQGARHLSQEASYRDLQREIAAVNRQVGEWYDSEFYGPSYAIELIERRAYDVADRALALANVLRRQFGLPRRQLGQYERDIERNIHEQAIAGRKRPPIWRVGAFARYLLAKQRCAQVPMRIRFHAARRKWTARLRQAIGLGGHSR